MGCGVSQLETQQANNNREINSFIRADSKKNEKSIKLLLLGAGEAGKSTFAKQMKVIHLSGFTHEELINYKPVIFANILESIQILIEGTKKFGHCLSPTNLIIAEKLLKLTPEIADFQNQNLFKQIQLVWRDEAIKKTFAMSYKLQLPDVAHFLFGNIERIANPNFIPDQNDCLRCRARTTGVVETSFQVDKLDFQLIDVGGQRSERRKWLYCFQDVVAILFLVALSEYDLTLWEDNTVNRMQESLNLFAATANSKWFNQTHKILFLNKSDIFLQKIRRKDLTCCFSDYTGGRDFLNATRFIEQKFTESIRSKAPVFTHITCATNTDNITFVFDAVKDILLRSMCFSSDDPM